MKTFLYTLILSFQTIILSAQAEKVLVKTISPQGNSVGLALPGTIEVKYSEGNNIRINMTLTSNNATKEMLNQLIAYGRYEVTTKYDQGEFTIYMPKINSKELFIGGEKITESFKFEVTLPYWIDLTKKGLENN